jgi:lysophospholipase L1-like esterase
MMETIYWDEQKMKIDGASASILAIGDSWFWYPFHGGSLASYLGPIVSKRGHVILAKGMNGAEAADYVGKYAKMIGYALKAYGKDLSAVFISGGGNDFAGFNDLRPLLKADCSAETTAKGCFLSGANGLTGFLDSVEESYRQLIGTIYTHTTLNCYIVMHTYDYAIPDGRGVAGHGGWLKPALVAAGVKTPLHKDCMKYLIDSFNDRLKKLARMDPNHLLIVDSRGTLGPAEWANELHPTGAGFKKIADTKWKPALQALNLA